MRFPLPPDTECPGEGMAFSKDHGLQGALGKGMGSPSSRKPPCPAQPYIDFSYTYVQGGGGRGYGRGGGDWAKGRGKPLLNRHLYIYINNFSVHRTVGGNRKGIERARERGGVKL
jgi:hypothetical protein